MGGVAELEKPNEEKDLKESNEDKKSTAVNWLFVGLCVFVVVVVIIGGTFASYYLVKKAMVYAADHLGYGDYFEFIGNHSRLLLQSCNKTFYRLINCHNDDKLLCVYDVAVGVLVIIFQILLLFIVTFSPILPFVMCTTFYVFIQLSLIAFVLAGIYTVLVLLVKIDYAESYINVPLKQIDKAVREGTVKVVRRHFIQAGLHYSTKLSAYFYKLNRDYVASN